MKKILAIDDIQDNLTTLEAVIKMRLPQCEVLSANSGEAGIEIAENELPDVILLDIIMPHMDGYEVCKRLKANNSTQHIPIIMITAIKTDSQSRVKGLNLGADAFLSKPIDPIELTAQVSVMLRIKEAEDKLREENVKLDDLVNERTLELQESVEFNKSVMQTAVDAIITINSEGLILSWNEAAEKIFGYTYAEMSSKDLLRLIPQQYKAGHIEGITRLKNKGHKYLIGKTIEISALRKDGSEFPIELSLSTWEVANKMYFTGIIRDITERKKAEEEIVKLSTAVEQSPSVIAITDLKGRIVYVNRKFTELTGYSKEESMGQNPSILKSGMLPDIIYKELWKIISSGKEWHGEFHNKKKNGDFFWEFVAISPILDEQGKITNYLKVAEDITERKIAEDALKSIASQFSSVTGFDFFEKICRHLCDTLEIDYAFVGELIHKYEKVNVIAGIGKGKAIETFSYDLIDTPCKKVLEKSICVYPTNVQGLFPKDHLLVEMGIDAYVGIPLFDSKGKTTGIIVLMDSKPISNTTIATNLLQIFSERVASEMERLKYQVELQKSTDFLSTIYDNSEVALFVIKVNGIGNYIYEGVNSQHEELFKVKEKEYIGKSPRELVKIFGKEPIEYLYRIYEECIKTKKSHNSEFEVPIGNKKEWWYSTLTPVIDSKGTVIRIIGSAINITDRKRIEAALRESENEYRTLVSNIPGITYRALVDEFWTMEFISNDIERLTAYPSEDFIRNKIRSYESIIHPDDSKRIRDEVEKAIKKSEAFSLEYRIICSNGDICWVSENGIGVADFEGKLLYIDGVILDITERKRAEQVQAVLYNIANAANTTKNVSELIQKIQIETGNIIDTTNFYIAFYNNSDDTLRFPFYEDQKDNFKIISAKKTLTKYVIETEKPFLANIKIKKKLVSEGRIEQKGSLSKIWLGVPLRIEGEVTGVLAVQSYTNENAFDESDMKVLEFISDQISISIDKKRKDGELIAAKERAEESDRLKTAFLANMSHEIRTPMNGIIGFAKLLSKPDLKPEKTLEYTTIVTDCSNQLLNIVNDILDISKIETGQIDVYMNDISINNVISEVFNLFERKAKDVNIKLNTFKDLDNGNDSIRTDSAKFIQILSNLVNNAIKFTIEGSVNLGYNVKKDFIEFYVKDTGIGIPEKDQENVFNRFAQAENAEIDLRGGTGLGLSISKGYVSLLGGEIWLKSKENQGTEFYFTLPFNGSAIISENKMEQIKEDTEFKNTRILIVEDEMSNFYYIAELLKEREIKYLHALNGKEAIELYKESPNFNLILMDIRMPIMDGYEATKLIKEINPDIPIIAQTAYAFTQDREKILDSGFDDYISKPIEEDGLMNLLEKYLKKQ